MRTASIQLAVVENDKAATIAKAVSRIEEAAQGADLVILPEIWNLGFMSFERYLSEAEDLEGPTLSALRQAAVKTGVLLHTGSFVLKDGQNYFNASFLIGTQGEILAQYRKIHLFGYNSQETQLLTPGNEVVVVDTPLGRMGLATCYDLRFPELFRKMSEAEAQVFLICSAWPYPRLEAWIMVNRMRALENQCFLVSANSSGLNLGGMFTGHSMAVDPWGTILASGGDDETIVRAELDLSLVEEARAKFPALADRRDFLK